MQIWFTSLSIWNTWNIALLEMQTFIIIIIIYEFVCASVQQSIKQVKDYELIIIIIIIPTYEKTLINKNISHKRHREQSLYQNLEIHSVLRESSKLK